MSGSKVLLALALVVAAAAHGQQTPELLLPLTSTGEVRAEEQRTLAELLKEEGVVGGRLMRLNRPMLAKLAGSGHPAGTQMKVALAPNDVETVRIESAATDARGEEEITGNMKGTDETTFSLALDKSGAAGTVDMGARFFEIRGVDADAVGVLEIDRAKLSPDDDESGATVQPPPTATGSAPPPAAKGGKITTFRVLIVYSTAAAQQAGRNVNTIATIAVMNLNTALRQSQINAQASLVGTVVVTTVPDNLGNTPLQTLMAVGPLKRLRVEKEADIVTAIVTQLPGVLRGKGNIFRGSAREFAPDAYSVVKFAAVMTYTYAHEVGHNLGCAHDDQGGGRFINSHGYQVRTETTGQKRVGFRTVMARGGDCPGDSCPRVLHFSDPNVQYGNRPTGTADRNNAETIRLTISDVARFHKLISASPP